MKLDDLVGQETFIIRPRCSNYDDLAFNVASGHVLHYEGGELVMIRSILIQAGSIGITLFSLFGLSEARAQYPPSWGYGYGAQQPYMQVPYSPWAMPYGVYPTAASYGQAAAPATTPRAMPKADGTPPTKSLPAPTVTAPQVEGAIVHPPEVTPGVVVGEVVPGPILTESHPVILPAAEPKKETSSKFVLDTQADFLLWWVTRTPVTTPLVTTGPTGIPRPGVIGSAGTSVLYGGSPVDLDAFTGFRLGVNGWLDSTQQWGFMAQGFFLNPNTKSFQIRSDATGSPVIAQPALLTTAGESAYLISRPGQFSGGIAIDNDLHAYGWDINAAAKIVDGGNWRVHGLLGFRNFRLSEQLDSISSFSPLVNGLLTFNSIPVPVGTTIALRDTFSTANEVYAGQIGARFQWSNETFGFDLLGKVGLGAVDQFVRVQGTSVASPAVGGLQTSSGGLYALESNKGDTARQGQFIFIPEVQARVMYLLTKGVRLSAGYSFLYLSDVVRPGAQIDRTLNPSFVPTDPDFGTNINPRRPTVTPESSSMWLHGLNLGVELSF